MNTNYSRGGYLPSATPLLMTRQPGTPCACGERTYRFDGGPDEHVIPRGTTAAGLRAWADHCPLLRIEDARARVAVGLAR